MQLFETLIDFYYLYDLINEHGNNSFVQGNQHSESFQVLAGGSCVIPHYLMQSPSESMALQKLYIL